MSSNSISRRYLVCHFHVRRPRDRYLRAFTHPFPFPFFRRQSSGSVRDRSGSGPGLIRSRGQNGPAGVQGSCCSLRHRNSAGAGTRGGSSHRHHRASCRVRSSCKRSSCANSAAAGGGSFKNGAGTNGRANSTRRPCDDLDGTESEASGGSAEGAPRSGPYLVVLHLTVSWFLCNSFRGH